MAAFACIEYKVQGRTLNQVALELRGTRMVHVFGQAVPSQCDLCSLCVQLSWPPSVEQIQQRRLARACGICERGDKIV